MKDRFKYEILVVCSELHEHNTNRSPMNTYDYTELLVWLRERVSLWEPSKLELSAQVDLEIFALMQAVIIECDAKKKP